MTAPLHALAEAPRLLNIDEAATYLNVPRTWLRDKVTARAVPHTRIGRHVRFTLEHLEEIVSQGEQITRPGRRDVLAPSGRRRR